VITRQGMTWGEAKKLKVRTAAEKAYDEDTETDMALVTLIPWQGSGTSKTLYHGPASGRPKEVTK
jgi:hypothetical protein